MEIVVFGIVAAIVLGIFVGVVKAKKASAYTKDLTRRFPTAKIFVSDHDFSYCVVDFDASRLILGLSEPRGFLAPQAAYEASYAFRHIAKVEMVSNGATVSTTNRGSQAMGAAVGALAFGGFGAVLGGLSGSTTTRDRLRKLSLSIHVDDRDRPVHSITFLNAEHNKKGVDPSGLIATLPLQRAEEFSAHIANAMRGAVTEAVSIAQPAASPATSRRALSPDVSAGHIRQIWELMQMGAITAEEFETQKRRILSS